MEGSAEAKYMEAKTAVFWDIDNCQVPAKGCDHNAIAKNISSSLLKMNYCGRVSISAYGDINRMPINLQRTLTSTGITLINIPTGVKEACDKKILVDMLLWAVDNPAPANYLLISGDRDFSNALHELSLRRYNILLAQLNASAPLLAAAKSVWLWTHLLAGGPPIPNDEVPPQFGSNNSTSSGDMMKKQGSEPTYINQSMNPDNENASSGNQKLLGPGKTNKNKHIGNKLRINPSQLNISRSLSAPLVNQEIKNNGSPQPSHLVAAPYEPFGKSIPSRPIPNVYPPNTDSTWSNWDDVPSRYPEQYSQPPRPNNIPIRPDYFQSNTLPLNVPTHGYQMSLRPDGPAFPSGPSTNVSDLSKLSISDHPQNVQMANYQQGYGSKPRQKKIMGYPGAPNSCTPNGLNSNIPQNVHMVPNNTPFYHGTQNSSYLRSPEFPPSSSGMSISPSWGTLNLPKPSNYVQNLIGVILLALNTLKNNKIAPTEANITDCIRYGDPNHSNTNVKMALDSAIEQQIVGKFYIGLLDGYLPKNEPTIWSCINTMGHTKYPKDIWEKIYFFLSSAGGKDAMRASRCRYEAAIILKSSCLEDFVLGEILQILNMVITSKRWISVSANEWQPITITLGPEATSSTKSGN